MKVLKEPSSVECGFLIKTETKRKCEMKKAWRGVRGDCNLWSYRTGNGFSVTVTLSMLQAL